MSQNAFKRMDLTKQTAHRPSLDWSTVGYECFPVGGSIVVERSGSWSLISGALYGYILHLPGLFLDDRSLQPDGKGEGKVLRVFSSGRTLPRNQGWLNFWETRLVTVRKSLYRSCWTELTCHAAVETSLSRNFATLGPLTWQPPCDQERRRLTVLGFNIPSISVHLDDE